MITFTLRKLLTVSSLVSRSARRARHRSTRDYRVRLPIRALRLEASYRSSLMKITFFASLFRASLPESGGRELRLFTAPSDAAVEVDS